MKKHFYSALLCLCATLWVQNVTAQIVLKLQYLEAENAWGVFAKPGEGMDPSDNLIPGSGQITLVMPAGFSFGNVGNHGGTWINNATVESPRENPSKDYRSFGFTNNYPPIKLKKGEETLLFSVEKLAGDCPDTLYLIDNEDDPFSQVPNSVGTNPGNNLSIFDAINRLAYDVAGVYDRMMWNCDPDARLSSNEEVFEIGAFKVSPNPASNMTILDMPFQEGNLSIKNQLGQTIHKIRNYQSGQAIQLDAFSKGLYSLVVEHDGVFYTQKLLIQK
ncbi:MAG: T9SS type A sorting domain-containing protein [Saprospiraceae bacterium]